MRKEMGMAEQMEQNLGQRLKEVRELRGHSLRELADKAGISASYLQKLERDQVQSPSPNVLYALSKELKVPYSQLMKRAGYVVPRGTRERTPVSSSVMAYALSSEELTEEEAAELAKYLAWYRQSRSTQTT